MQSTLRFIQALNTAAYSEVTISCSGREFQANKIVICNGSEYFKELCGNQSTFAESSSRIIELKDDDSDALMGTLEWLCSGEYASAISADRDASIYALDLYAVADKYGLSELMAEIVLAMMLDMPDPEKLVKLIAKVYDDGLRGPALRIVHQLRDSHLQALRYTRTS